MSGHIFWDKEAIYDEKIAPLMKQIIEICKEHAVPVVATFQYCDTEDDGPGFCTTVLPGEHQSERMRSIAQAVRPERPIAFTETIVTKPDGTKQLTIGRLL